MALMERQYCHLSSRQLADFHLLLTTAANAKHHISLSAVFHNCGVIVITTVVMMSYNTKKEKRPSSP